GAGMSIVMGGSEKNTKVATIGGLLGGLGIGVLILLSHLAIFSRVDVVGNYDLPLLKIFDEISPILSTLMSLVLFGMIFNECVSSFVYCYVGCTKLVEWLYLCICFIGLVLILVLIKAPFKILIDAKKEEITS